MKQWISDIVYIKTFEGVKFIFLSVFGNLLGTALSAIALIIISRQLGPTDFGGFSAGFSLVLILTRINELGLNTAVLKLTPSAETKAQNFVFSITLAYKLVFSLLIAVLGLIFISPIAELLNFSNTSILAISLTLGLATVYYEQLLTILQSLHRFYDAVAINGIQAAVKLGGSLLLLFGVINSMPLIYGIYVTAPLVPVIWYITLLGKKVSLRFNTLKSASQKPIFRIAQHSAIALICSGIIENVDVLFLQRYLNSYETGLYSGVSRIALLFSLVAYSLALVLNPRVARYKKRTDVISYLWKAIGIILLSVIGFLFFTLVAKSLIGFTIGSEYTSGLGILNILAASSFLTIASVPLIALFYSYDSDWYFSVSGIAQLIIVVLGNWIFVPVYGLEAAAWTRLTARLFLFSFTLVLALIMYHIYHNQKAAYAPSEQAV